MNYPVSRRNRPFSIESLESRIAPAANILAIGGLTTASFFDPDGDLVMINIRGTAGSIDIDEVGATNGIVDNGEAIGRISLTGASADFVLTVTVDSIGASDGIVDLGAVTSNRPILALNTVGDRAVGAPESNFRLGSYTGPGFTTGGGFTVGSIAGDNDGKGVVLANLGADTTLNVRGTLAGDVEIAGVLAGTIKAGNVGSGAWTLAGISATGQILSADSFEASVMVSGSVAGDVNLGGSATAGWNVGAIQPTAMLQATGWNDLTVRGNFAGRLVTLDGVTGNAAVNIMGSMGATAVINSGGNSILHVAGSVASKARVDAGLDLTATVDGAFAGRFTAGDDLTLSVPNGNTSGQLSANDSLQFGGKAIVNARLSADNVELLVQKNVSGTIINAGSLQVDVDGDVANSRFLAAGGSVGVNVAGNVLSSQLTGSTVTVTISGALTSSQIEGNGQLSIGIGKNANGSDIISRGTMNAAFSAAALNMHVSAVGQTSLLVNGNFKGTVANSEDRLNVIVVGDVLPGTQIISTDEARVRSATFAGTLSANSLDFTATESVVATARIQAGAIADLTGDDTAFSVAGDFAGRLTVHGDFESGDGLTATLVEGTVLPTARITIGGSINGPGQYVFANAFLGRLHVGGDVNQDILFGGNVNSLFVGGGINADLVVIGKVASIVAGNVFVATDENDGTFRDGAGNFTGTLDTTLGFGKVTSTL